MAFPLAKNIPSGISEVQFQVSHNMHNRMEAPRGLTSDLAPNNAGHLDTLHTSIAKIGYFTDIRWSNRPPRDPDLQARRAEAIIQ